MIDNVDNIVKDGGCMEEMEDGCVRERRRRLRKDIYWGGRGRDGGYILWREGRIYIYIYIRYVRMDVGDDGMCM